jgi:hypothetical protein
MVTDWELLSPSQVRATKIPFVKSANFQQHFRTH